jgi:chaperonin GroES
MRLLTERISCLTKYSVFSTVAAFLSFFIENQRFLTRCKKEGRMKIRPLQDRVIIRRIQEEETSKGGIIIPDTAKEKPQEGKVIAVGKGKVDENGKLIPLAVKVNERVLFGKYSGTEINIDGEEHLIVREEDILGIIEE